MTSEYAKHIQINANITHWNESQQGYFQKCKTGWHSVWQMPQHSFCATYHASAAPINYLETLKLKIDNETSFLSNYKRFILHECMLLTNDAVKNLIWGFGLLPIKFT